MRRKSASLSFTFNRLDGDFQRVWATVMDSLSAYFAFSDIPGHVSYLIIAISYCLTNIYWLRVAAVVGLGLEIMYFLLTSNLLYAGIAWDLIFIAINGFHLVFLTRDRFSLKLAGDERALMRGAFVGLHDSQVAQILKTGSWREMTSGTTVTEEGGKVEELYFVQRGSLAVYAKGMHVAELGPGALVGEIAFLTGSSATATVVVNEETRVIAFDHTRLLKACRRDDQIAAAMHKLIGCDLARKIARADLRINEAGSLAWPLPSPVAEEERFVRRPIRVG
jgi:CRP-like cAMP-binding protein